MLMLTGLLFDPCTLKIYCIWRWMFGFVALWRFFSVFFFFNYLAYFSPLTWCYIISISVCKLKHTCVTNHDSK